MKRKIKGLYINPSKNISSFKTIEDELNAYYKLLDCSTIDIVSRKIGGKVFEIVCDDEGLLKQSPIVSAVDSDGHPALVGSLFICNSEGEHLSSLTPNDTDYLYEHIAFAICKDGTEIVVLTDVDN